MPFYFNINKTNVILESKDWEGILTKMYQRIRIVIVKRVILINAINGFLFSN